MEKDTESFPVSWRLLHIVTVRPCLPDLVMCFSYRAMILRHQHCFFYKLLQRHTVSKETFINTTGRFQQVGQQGDRYIFLTVSQRDKATFIPP